MMQRTPSAIKVLRLQQGRGSYELKADPDALPADAWDWASGAPASETQECYRAVAVLNRGLGLVCNAVSSLPFRIMDGATEIDNSADWQNACGFLPDPVRLLWLMQAASYVWGYAYLWRERNKVALKNLRYLLPTTVTPQIDPDKGLTGFRRSVNSQVIDATTENIVYLWRPDPYVEIGHPLSSPVQAASAAAGVLLNVDKFAAAFFARGAIKATLLTVEGALPPLSERERLKSWWQNVIAGLKNAFASEVINAAVKPVVVGEGIKELSDVTLTEAAKQDVAIALGIPMSILFSQTAAGLGGGGVAAQDDIHFYTKTVVPESNLLAECLNMQVWQPQGLHMEFLPETLDVFQTDETQRAASLAQLVGALQDPISAIAMQILGYELSEDVLRLLQEYWAGKEKQSQPVVAPALPPPQPAPTAQLPPNEREDEGEADAGDTEVQVSAVKSEMALWRRKALKRLRESGSAACEFSSTVLAPELRADIANSLPECRTPAAVKALFDEQVLDLPDMTDDLVALAGEYARASELLAAVVHDTHA